MLAVAIATGGSSCAGPPSNTYGAYEAGRQAFLDHDYETAFKEYKIAAEGGDARAQAHIARMYYDGRHVPRNYVLAYGWFHLAMATRPDAVTGDQATIELLKIKMSPAELQEGEAELARLTREVARSATKDSVQWRKIPPEQADLVVSVPTLERSRGVFARSVEGFVVKEYAVWSDAGASASTAAITLARIKSIGPKTLVFTRDTSLEDDIRRFLPSAQVSSERTAKMNNRIGEVEYRRFARDGTRECVYMRQFADTFADQRGYTRSFKPSAGNIVIRGWYCAPPAVTLSHDTIEVFVKGLGIREFAVPEHDAD
jgi:hypothetical protein